MKRWEVDCVARARMTRSELKARDEITTTLESLTENAMARKKEILVGLAIVLVLAGGLFFGWRYYSLQPRMPRPRGNSPT